MRAEAGRVVICPECGHSSDAHGVEGCEARNWSCPCPLEPGDILPMTQEQRDEFDRNRYRASSSEVGASSDDLIGPECDA